MKLIDALAGKKYEIINVEKSISARLSAYGFFVHTKVCIIKKDNKMLIVQVCNSLYAINFSLASKVEVGEV